MTTLPQTPAVHEPDPAVRSRSLILGSRLMLGANLTAQLSFLFAYLYLRANNNNGMWHPDGVGPPPIGLALTVLGLQVVAFAVVWAASASLSRDPSASGFVRMLEVGLVLGVACLAFRLFQITHLGWTADQGTYVDISILWLFFLAAQVFIGILWLIKLLSGQMRRTVLVNVADLRSAAEYWAFVTVVSIGVFLLVQYVT
jgi:heme/copper-type cytochrome/quinol oxidase subunit 3